MPPSTRLAPVVAAIAAFVLFGTTTAFAQSTEGAEIADEYGDQTDSFDDGNKVSLTISPAHLTLPMLEVYGEFRLADQIGLAAIAGGGVIDDVFVIEGGAQGNFYFLGDFDHGLHAGAQTVVLHGRDSQGDISATATAFVAGGYLGYKFVASFGLTFALQFGGAYMAIGGEATMGEETAVLASESEFMPLLNLNLGWSF